MLALKKCAPQNIIKHILPIQSGLATSTKEADNIMDPDDPNSTWDISEADENTKRFFGKSRNVP